MSDEIDDQCQNLEEIQLEKIKNQAMSFPKSELITLLYNDQLFCLKLKELNQKGCECIAGGQFYEAIRHLSQAEYILEYAASCGKTIERTLIITTLHNEACIYQKSWNLPKSADYIEAIIYNIGTFLNGEALGELGQESIYQNSSAYNKLSLYLGNQIRLIFYHLQFCAISSQIKHHEISLKSAMAALELLKHYCTILHSYELLNKTPECSQLQKNILSLLSKSDPCTLRNMSQTEEEIKMQHRRALKSMGFFQSQMRVKSLNLSQKELKELEHLSIGNVMQIAPSSIQVHQERHNLNEELSFIHKIYKAIYISIAYFTIATELRLMALQKNDVPQFQRKNSLQFKQSQIYHYCSIINAALHIPCYTKLFQHILNSFKNHYQIDLVEESKHYIFQGELDCDETEEHPTLLRDQPSYSMRIISSHRNQNRKNYKKSAPKTKKQTKKMCVSRVEHASTIGKSKLQTSKSREKDDSNKFYLRTVNSSNTDMTLPKAKLIQSQHLQSTKAATNDQYFGLNENKSKTSRNAIKSNSQKTLKPKVKKSLSKHHITEERVESKQKIIHLYNFIHYKNKTIKEKSNEVIDRKAKKEGWLKHSKEKNIDQKRSSKKSIEMKHSSKDHFQMGPISYNFLKKHTELDTKPKKKC